jgi:hypothetical protein
MVFMEFSVSQIAYGINKIGQKVYSRAAAHDYKNNSILNDTCHAVFWILGVKSELTLYPKTHLGYIWKKDNVFLCFDPSNYMVK